VSFEPVDFLVTDKSPIAIPVPNVLVKVYSADGRTFYTQTTTDMNGVASFLLDSSVSYSARFYKVHVGFQQPQLFTVVEGGGLVANSFVTRGDVLTPPIATDPRLCRASGFFRDLNGAPKKFLDIMFIAKFAPILLEGDAIFTERVELRTDEQGYAEVDLIRFAQYDAYVEANEDQVRLINVPDSPSVNLPDLLLPVVASITFAEEAPYSTPLDTSLFLTPTVMTSDGRELPCVGSGDVLWRSDDETVFSVSNTRTQVVIHPAARGTAHLTATRADQTIIRIPNTPISGQPVEIVIV
jgi:hypothetical protein